MAQRTTPEYEIYIFERAQEEYSIEELTQANINDLMNNQAHTRTDKWKENVWKKRGGEYVKTDRTRSRTRTEYVPFSNAKDRIAGKMSEVKDIYDSLDSADKVPAAQSRLDSFTKDYKLINDNIQKMRDKLDSLSSGIIEDNRTKIDRYVERGDFAGLKAQNYKFEDRRIEIDSKDIQQNALYNLAGQIIREARADRDLARLEQLRSDVQGTMAEERIGEIDRAIDRLRR